MYFAIRISNLEGGDLSEFEFALECRPVRESEAEVFVRNLCVIKQDSDGLSSAI